MKKTLLCYSLGKIEPKLRTKFGRELFGYHDKSNCGKYAYPNREGILRKKDYKKLMNGVIIVNKDVVKKVIRHLKKYKVKYWQFGI